MQTDHTRGLRSVQLSLLSNAALALVKLTAGVVGTSYALVADAIESSADIFASLIVWTGLRIANRDPDHDYPFGYGKAENVASAAVSLMLIGAAVGIAVQAVREIVTPHHAPAPWTLGVLVAVVVVKTLLYRRIGTVGREVGSTAVQADAWHHMSDALTSAAAFIGIGFSVLMGPGWESSDDWAALVASVVIAFTGTRMLRGALRDLMDRNPGAEIASPVRRVAEGVPGVQAIEKLLVRRTGMAFHVEIHVQADAWHHMSDALTSAAAFIGIGFSVLMGPGWESSDDWAALAASVVIAFTGTRMLRGALRDLMDRNPGAEIASPVRRVAEGVPGVLAIEKLLVRRTGMAFHVEIHVQADPHLSLQAAHALGGAVKSAIRTAQPRVRGVLIHMEPYESADGVERTA